MRMGDSIKINIATAQSRLAKRWKNRIWRWSDFVERCRQFTVTPETAAQYARMSREEQSNIKDVGGFVGGYLSDGVRRTANVRYRTMVTLDIDYGTPDVWDTVCLNYHYAAVLYSTHKHTADAPRLRLVMPFSREVAPDEYEPICRRIAEDLGIELFDVSTYELARLFYWPSRSQDADFVFEHQEGPPINPDEFLSLYTDYHDVSSWPTSDREADLVRHEARKAGDPTEKPGLIGAFCRTYSIQEAMDEFLPGVYVETAQQGRYTYSGGSVAGGLVIYEEGKFAYSHHETDPAGRKLLNAFDLVRIHRFGSADEGLDREVTKMPSYEAMTAFVAGLHEVCRLMTVEQRASATEDFSEVSDASEEDNDWMGKLKRTKKGGIECTIENMALILENDPSFKGHLFFNEFTHAPVVRGGLPWDEDTATWSDNDDANLRLWMEKNYSLSGKDKIADALASVLTRHRFHPIRDYLNSLRWDGIPRLERLVIDYIGADDNELSRAMTRKHFVAAVARVFSPGCKYDYCLTLTGPEGVGKSTLISIMGGEWFSDSVTTMEGKEGMEQLRRAWMVELAELSSIKKSEVEQVKAFLSKQRDIYRAAYARRVTDYPRQCVFFGTTNEALFLKGDTGNRRFWVIEVQPEKRRYEDGYTRLKTDRDQLWAEAVTYFKEGERLFLNYNLEVEARERQREFNDDHDDPLRPLLENFLEASLPSDWATRGLTARRRWLRDRDPLDAEGTEPRTRFCIAEFICEQMGRDLTDKEYKYLARKIGTLMERFPQWSKSGTSRHAAHIYGRQKAYVREVRKEEGM